jgi:hypothetical protein
MEPTFPKTLRAICTGMTPLDLTLDQRRRVRNVEKRTKKPKPSDHACYLCGRTNQNGSLVWYEKNGKWQYGLAILDVYSIEIETEKRTYVFELCQECRLLLARWPDRALVKALQDIQAQRAPRSGVKSTA